MSVHTSVSADVCVRVCSDDDGDQLQSIIINAAAFHFTCLPGIWCMINICISYTQVLVYGHSMELRINTSHTALRSRAIYRHIEDTLCVALEASTHTPNNG